AGVGGAAGRGRVLAACSRGAPGGGPVVVLAPPATPAPDLAPLVAVPGAWLALAAGGPAALPGGRPRPPLTVHPGGIPAGPGPAAQVRASPDDTALLAYTSGTTGRPKAVPLTHRQLLTSVRVAMTAAGWREDDVRAHALPVCHLH